MITGTVFQSIIHSEPQIKKSFHMFRCISFENVPRVLEIIEQLYFGTPRNRKMHSPKKSLRFLILLLRILAQNTLHASRPENGPGRGRENERPVKSLGRDFWMFLGDVIALAHFILGRGSVKVKGGRGGY